MTTSWLDLFAAAVSGGLIVKFLDVAYAEYRRRSEKSISSMDMVDRHLDPILKAADELVGKIRDLAQTDFNEIQKARSLINLPEDITSPYFNLVYLFANFWARVQALRIDGNYVNLGANKTGSKLLTFISALEASRTRLLSRAFQRGIGEALIEISDSRLRAITYYEFVRSYKESPEFRIWFDPLVVILDHVNHTKDRQRLLVYGAILHALIDTLDEKHLVTKGRPGWANKLSKKSRRDLRFRIFRVYLQFVPQPDRYYQP